MSLFMIHKAYMPVYKLSRFLARDGRDGTGRDGTGRDQPKVVQEVLADLKINGDVDQPTNQPTDRVNIGQSAFLES